MAKALLTDGLLSTLPAADACPADLCMVGKLLTVPAFCLPVSAEEVSAAPDPTGNGTAAPDQQKLCLKARDPRTGTVAQRLASRITGRIKGAACGRRT